MALQTWIRERFGLVALLDHLIPSHANSPTYVLGGVVVVLGLIQGITGILLQQFYHPTPDENAAYVSVQFIRSVPLWSFVRNLHYWGSQLIVTVVLLHMMRVYVSAAYKKPREILWISGLGLLVTAWLLAFTGTVLKWDQEGVEALGHNLELAEFAGPLGYWFSPEFAPDVPILVRLNSAHVTILPLVAALLVSLHVYLIRVLGISSPKNGRSRMSALVPFSTHVKKMILYGFLAVIFTSVLGIVVGAPFSSIGNPAIEVSKPEWYMLWIYSIEGWFGLQTVPYVLTPALILMLVAPLLDRSDETDPRKRKLMMALLIVGVIAFAGLTINAALQAPVSHLE